MGRPKREDGRRAQTVANNKYNEKNYDRINLTIPKGEKAEISAAAAAAGESVNEFIRGAVRARMAKENA